MRIVLLLLCIMAAPAASISLLDGRILQGPTLTYVNNQLHIGNDVVQLADCDWIEAGSGSGVSFNRAPWGMWLVDGSWLPVSSITAASVDHVVHVVSPLGTLDLPLTALRGWSSKSELSTDDKMDRVVLDSGAVTGRIEGIHGGNLLIRSDLSPDKPLELALDQIRELSLAIPISPPTQPTLSVILDPDRPALLLNPGDPARLAAAPSISLPRWADSPLIAARLRVNAGRRVYLSDLTPTEVHDDGAFGVVWPWKRDSNLDGTPLRLGGQRYTKGIVVHSQAHISWTLGGLYSRFRAVMGIADIVAKEGDCAVTISGNGKVLWTQSSITGREKPLLIDLDLSNIQTLDLRVDLGNRYDIGDHLALADAYLIVRAPTSAAP